LETFDFTPCYKVDFIFSGGDFRGQDIVEIAELKSIWGQGIDEPYVAIENVKISSENIYLMSADKNPTLKISTYLFPARLINTRIFQRLKLFL
jgi:hypothetical protein